MRYQSHSLAVIKGARIRRGCVVGVGLTLCLGIFLTPLLATAGTATEAVKSTIDQVVRLLEDKELNKPDRVMM